MNDARTLQSDQGVSQAGCANNVTEGEPPGWTKHGLVEPRYEPPEISIYADGMHTQAPGKRVGNPAGVGGGIRGKVTKWTKASQRRLRERLMLYDVPGRLTIGATFTVPGGVYSPDWYRKLFHGWASRAAVAGWSAIWRLEVQPGKKRKAGAGHWHLMFAVPCPVHGEDVEHCDAVCHLLAGSEIQRSWMAALDRQGIMDYGGLKKLDGPDNEWARSGNLTLIQGASTHACVVEFDQGDRVWKRYLEQHATKRKQAQIAVGFGRHWGVVGRKWYKRRLPDEVIKFTPVQYYRFIRCIERLQTPSRKAACAFGRKLGTRARRGRYGRQVIFCDPETARRVARWVLATDAAEGPPVASSCFLRWSAAA